MSSDGRNDVKLCKAKDDFSKLTVSFKFISFLNVILCLINTLMICDVV